MDPLHKEAARQQLLLRRLLGAGASEAARAVDDPSAGLLCAVSPAAAGVTLERGISAYRANAAALAERALGAAFPTLQQLIGDESFVALARDFWRQYPPLAGDMACWGEGLAEFVGSAASLADEPCLADVARVDWAVHIAGRAADAPAVQGLKLLAELDPAQLLVQLVPGTAIVESPHPVATIWHAHRQPAGEGDRFAAVRAAFAAGQGEAALVFRQGWSPRVLAVPAAEVEFTRALLAAQTLDAALHRAGDGFDFQSWLIAALQQQRLLAVIPLPVGDERRP